MQAVKEAKVQDFAILFLVLSWLHQGNKGIAPFEFRSFKLQIAWWISKVKSSTLKGIFKYKIEGLDMQDLMVHTPRFQQDN